MTTHSASLKPPLLPFSLAKRLTAEGLGSLLLVAVVVGSGIMGERLAAGNMAIALLANAVATGAALVVLITVLGPISGAHFNPVVTVAFAIRRELAWPVAVAYGLVQVLGACLGAILAHAMFALPLLQVSAHARDGVAQVISEVVATFGLILTIFGCLRFRADATPGAVGLYITAAYWFTASTSFANPAVTIARMLTNTFAGIAPASAPAFIAAQIAGLVAALGLTGWLLKGKAAMADRFDVVIHHNPDCGTSRNVLALVEAAGYQPVVIEYLKVGWTRPQLLTLLAVMGAGPRDVMRDKGTPAVELGLLEDNVSDERLIEAMIEHPILVNRPIVATPKGVKLCRPSEAVFDLLDKKSVSFAKEDGEVVKLWAHLRQ